MAEFKS